MPKLLNRHLLLVNRQHPLSKEDRPTALVVTSDCQFPVQLEHVVAVALQQLFASINSANQIVQVSGYRDYATQEALYVDSLKAHGHQFTKSYVASPGTSEHQTGLAIDVGLKVATLDYLCPLFPEEGICLTFTEMASKFGFILRYPAGKEAITTIAHEPWHFRYVGYPHSQIIADNRWTLEEYISVLQSCDSLTEAYRWGPYEIVTVKEKELLPFFESMGPQHRVLEMSRNNCGAVIVTCVTKGEECSVDGS